MDRWQAEPYHAWWAEQVPWWYAWPIFVAWADRQRERQAAQSPPPPPLTMKQELWQAEKRWNRLYMRAQQAGLVPKL